METQWEQYLEVWREREENGRTACVLFFKRSPRFNYEKIGEAGVHASIMREGWILFFFLREEGAKNAVAWSDDGLCVCV